MHDDGVGITYCRSWFEDQRISSEFEGGIDSQRLLGTNPNMRNGCQEIHVKFKIKGNADESTIQELVRKLPACDTLANLVKINIEAEKV